MDMETYLTLANNYKNGAMIMDWRQFVSKHLLPLDQEAERIIKTNSHLIRKEKEEKEKEEKEKEKEEEEEEEEEEK